MINIYPAATLTVPRPVLCVVKLGSKPTNKVPSVSRVIVCSSFVEFTGVLKNLWIVGWELPDQVPPTIISNSPPGCSFPSKQRHRNRRQLMIIN